MPFFEVSIKRVQSQIVTLAVEYKDKSSLEKKLQELDENEAFAEIDSVFDEGEVEYIEYEVSNIRPSKQNNVDEDFQDLIDQIQ